jgi:hypothetical protein
VPVRAHWAPAFASTRSEFYKALLATLIQAHEDVGVTQVEATQIGRRRTLVSKYETEERRCYSSPIRLRLALSRLQ